MCHGPTACAAPPIALCIGGDEGTQFLPMVVIKSLQRDVVGIAICSLHFMHVKTGREEQDRLAARSHKRFIDVRRYATRAGEDAKGRSFQQSEVAIPSTYTDDRLDLARVAFIFDRTAILHGPHFEL